MKDTMWVKLIGNRTGAGVDGDEVGRQMLDMGVQFVKAAACKTRA
jgi:hypothetical protein